MEDRNPMKRVLSPMSAACILTLPSLVRVAMAGVNAGDVVTKDSSS